jgi:hypothetical protein
MSVFDLYGYPVNPQDALSPAEIQNMQYLQTSSMQNAVSNQYQCAANYINSQSGFQPAAAIERRRIG